MSENIDPGVLAGFPVFSGISHEGLEELLRVAKQVHIGAGELLFAEDEPANTFFVLLSGGLDVFSHGNGTADHWLAHLGPGAPIGETSLLSDGLRSASARATESSLLISISDQTFQEQLDADSLPAYRLVLNLARMLAGRLRAADDQLIEVSTRGALPAEEEDDLDRLRRIFFKDWGL